MKNAKVFKWSQDQVDTLLNLNTKGKSVSEIAKLTNRPYRNVYSKLRQLNVKANVKVWTIDQPEKVSEVASKETLLEVLTAIVEVSKNTSAKTRVVINQGEVSVEFDHA